MDKFDVDQGIIQAGLISDLIAASKSGDTKPVSDAPSDWFDIELASHAGTRLSAASCAAVQSIHRAGGDALRLARTGEIMPAQKLMHSAITAVRALEGEARQLAGTILCGQRAYLCHRLGRDPAARALLRCAFRLDQALEASGYAALRMHRVQLLCNVLRLDVRAARSAKGVGLGLRLLAWIESGNPDVLDDLAHPWNSGWTAGTVGLPQELIMAMHALIATETLRAATKPALTKALADLPVAARVGQVGHWISLRQAFDQGTVVATIKAATRLLRLGARPSSPLWTDGATIARHVVAACVDAASAVYRSSDDAVFSGDAKTEKALMGSVQVLP